MTNCRKYIEINSVSFLVLILIILFCFKFNNVIRADMHYSITDLFHFNIDDIMGKNGLNKKTNEQIELIN